MDAVRVEPPSPGEGERQRAGGRRSDRRAWYRLRPFELATGTVLGMAAPEPRTAARPGEPRAVIEELLLDALQRPPCVVAFSGGRDSSAMLAVAMHVARRHGLPLPIPATRRFPGDLNADETGWQTRVIRHLGIKDWVRVSLQGRCDVVGPIASTTLRRHGLLWPPATFVNAPLFDVARSGTLVTGEGGDEVFGRHRVTPVLHLLRGGLRKRYQATRQLADALGPRAVRMRRLRRQITAIDTRAWLRPAVRAALIEELVRYQLAEPLSWRAATVDLARRRAWVLGAATRQRLADEYGVQVRHPLLAPRFLHAFAAAGSLLGPMSRADAMRRLFGDVLPPDVLRRTSKARFNAALLGEESKAFAAEWRGGGVDTDLVDEQRLRREWLQPLPHACSIALLQAAWMAARQWPLDGLS